MAQFPHEAWFRLLYSYPHGITAPLLEQLAADPRFCPYLDMPLQHVDDSVLKNMGRNITLERIEQKLELIRRHLPNAALRTTFIVGYPGETEAQFEKLLNFISEGHFQHVGVFTFSPEPGTPAADLPDSISANEKAIRQQALMEAQLAVSRRWLQNQIGETRIVMLDDPVQQAPEGLPEDITWIGHTQQQALDVDGIVWIRGLDNPDLQPGTRLNVKIESALDYDLVGSGVRTGLVPAP
jgi:ribosomal protein S12 methylthiotransferase